MTKTKRGHLVNYQLITDDPSKTKTGEIIKKFAKHLEDDIIQEQVTGYGHTKDGNIKFK